MMPITRRDLEILLDGSVPSDYIVSAYADLRVRDGFRNFAETELTRLMRAAAHMLPPADGQELIQSHLSSILEAVESTNSGARGVAVFSGARRKLFHTIPLSYPVANQLVLDEEPFLLPLLEIWHGIPSYLVALVDSHQIHLFETYAGVTESVGGVAKAIDHDTQRDKPRFSYKRRFSHTFYEHLHDLTQDSFLKQVAARITEHYRDRGNPFEGLVLLGQPPVTSAVRRLLPKEIAQAVVAEQSHSMTPRAEDVAAVVSQTIEQWQSSQRERLLEELHHRWSRVHLVANGPTAVLDALQQGRATDVIFGLRREMPGARCAECGYRFGTAVERCTYCQGPVRVTNAAQEILRFALRHKTARVHFLNNNGEPDPLEWVGGVAALLRAEANWKPTSVLAS